MLQPVHQLTAIGPLLARYAIPLVLILATVWGTGVAHSSAFARGTDGRALLYAAAGGVLLACEVILAHVLAS